MLTQRGDRCVRVAHRFCLQPRGNGLLGLLRGGVWVHDPAFERPLYRIISACAFGQDRRAADRWQAVRLHVARGLKSDGCEGVSGFLHIHVPAPTCVLAHGGLGACHSLRGVAPIPRLIVKGRHETVCARKKTRQRAVSDLRRGKVLLRVVAGPTHAHARPGVAAPQLAKRIGRHCAGVLVEEGGRIFLPSRRLRIEALGVGQEVARLRHLPAVGGLEVGRFHTCRSYLNRNVVNSCRRSFLCFRRITINRK